MNRLVDPEVTRVEIVDLKPLKVLGDLRWKGKAKFPGSPRPRSIIIFQLGDDIVAIPAFCPHEKADMSMGRFVEPYVLECPVHQNRYDLRTGAIKTFQVEAEDDRMYLLWKRNDKEPIGATFAALVQIGKREENERVKTLELELEAARIASSTRERHLVTTLQEMDGMIREVEEQKKTIIESSAKIAQMHQLVQRVTDSMSEALIVLDRNGRIRDVNPHFRTLLGYSADEISKLALDALLDLDTAKANHPELENSDCLIGRKAATLETELIAKDGSRIEHLLRIAPLYQSSGKRDGAVIVGTDIRQIKAAERRVRDAYTKVTTLLDNMRQAVFVVLPDGTIADPVSRFSAEVFGTEILGRNIDDVLYRDVPRNGEVYQGIRAALLTVFDAEEFQWDLMSELLPRRVVLKHHEDRVKVLKVEYCALYGSDELVKKLMVIVEDITHIELLEEENRKGDRQTQLLEELAKNSVDTLRSFLSTSYDQLRECRRNLDREDAESRAILLRNLHTLKGTSRVLGLTLIGEAAHEAENIALSPRDSERNSEALLSRDRLRDAISRVHRQVAEYSEVAERFLHLPNDLESKAVEELHTATALLDAQFACLLGADRDQSLRACAVTLHSKATDCREAALGSGNDGAAQAAKQLETSFAALANGSKPESVALGDLIERYESLLDRVSRSRLQSRAGAEYSLATSTWSSLYHEVYALSRAFLSADPTSTHELLWAADRARELAESLGADDLVFLLNDVVVRIRQGEDRAALRCRLRALWSHLSLHSTLESLVLLRPEERGPLLEAIVEIESSPERLERLLASGRVRVGSLVRFLSFSEDVARRAREWIETLGAFFDDAGTNRIGQAFVSARTDAAITAVLDELLALESFRDVNDWAERLGRPLPIELRPPFTFHTYLQRLDILRMVQAFRALGGGNYQLLFDRVETVEVMSYHFNRLKRSINEFRRNRSDHALDELQNQIDRLLDVPVIPSLYRYYAMVSDIANRLGKDVNLHIHGNSTAALPRERLSALHDALVHMLRNALDHGLEPHSQRLERQKPATGIIDIECVREEHGISLIIRDDGRGIDGEKLKAKALQTGVISADEAASLTAQQAQELIFKPRLSTAESVTDVSGRGVGMDAVRDRLASIDARLELESEIGVGTRFTIRLSTPTNNE